MSEHIPDHVFNQVVTWLPLVIALLSIVNGATAHYTKFNGIIRVVLAVLERLSILTSKHARTELGRLKPPFTDVLPSQAIEDVTHEQKPKKAKKLNPRTKKKVSR